MHASLRELNSNSSKLARRAQAGERIVITDHGVPIADIVPHRPRPRAVPKEDVVAVFGDLPPDDHRRFRQQLDEVVDPYIDIERVDGWI